MDILIERLKTAFNATNYKELSLKLGVKEGTIKTWVRRDSYDLKLIVSKCNPNINLNWLMTGHGPMFNSDQEGGMQEKDNKHVGIEEGSDDLTISPVTYEQLDEAGDLNLPWLLQENQEADKYIPAQDYDAFIAYLDKKDKIIRDLSEQIGRLKAQLEHLANMKP